MRTFVRAAAFMATAVFASSVEAQAPQIGLPDVAVTAAPPATTLPRPRDSMIAKWRNEEDKFVAASCGTTRLTAAAVDSARCLIGYRLTNSLGGGPGRFCDMGLDVVMYTAGNLTVEADILSFDPYKITAWGFPGKFCFIAPREISVMEFQDLNQVSRRGKNFGDVMRTGNDSLIGFVDANRPCIAMERLGPRWRGGHSWVMHATICRTDAQAVSTQDIAATTDRLLIRVYDPVGNLRGPPATLYSSVR
ncbi:MAG: hypothetical protein JO008_13310 [Alphaproteobacteria bacterium]|nr:hypothetical protein [Alphaproteobacteria bacterium]